MQHNPQKAIGFACSGGGRRLAEQLIRDGSSFRAVVLDSPADNVTAFLLEPRPNLLDQVILFLRPVRFNEVMEQFFVGIYGSVEQADAAALANNLDNVDPDVPIYLSYSSNDESVTLPIIEPLAQALAGRPSPSTVTLLDIEKHCQIDTDDGMARAINWLDDVIDMSGAAD